MLFVLLLKFFFLKISLYLFFFSQKKIAYAFFLTYILREAAKKLFFFNDPATKAGPLRRNTFF